MFTILVYNYTGAEKVKYCSYFVGSFTSWAFMQHVDQ